MNASFSVLLPLVGLKSVALAAPLVARSSAETTLNKNMGEHDDFHAGTTHIKNKRRGLLAVPSGNTDADPHFALHRMLTAWGEGDKTEYHGAPAGAGEAICIYTSPPFRP